MILKSPLANRGALRQNLKALDKLFVTHQMHVCYCHFMYFYLLKLFESCCDLHQLVVWALQKTLLESYDDTGIDDFQDWEINQSNATWYDAFFIYKQYSVFE